VGAAAHSFDGRNRRWNVADVGRYVETVAEGNPQHEEETLKLADAYNEYVMTALRTTAGIEKAKVERPFYAQLTKKMKRFEDEGLIEETPTHYKPTRRGLLQADGMAVELMVEG
jgi:oxygen-independent coproporphyrinogen-3 oxidase